MADSVTGEFLRSWPLPLPGQGADKKARGQVMVVGGSVQVPGGALLSALGALRAGAGKLQVATTSSTAIALGVALPEALVAGLPESNGGGIDPGAADVILEMAETAKAVLIGPGMMDREAVRALVNAVVRMLPADGPILVLDAGAVSCLEPDTDLLDHLRGRVIMTPNTDELARVVDEDPEKVDHDRRRFASLVAERLGTVVAVRGWIVSPDGRAWRYDGGTAGLATSGSGDVLSGIVTGLAARGAEPEQAAVWGLYTHGRAGELVAARVGRLGYLARELLDEIPGVLTETGN